MLSRAQNIKTSNVIIYLLSFILSDIVLSNFSRYTCFFFFCELKGNTHTLERNLEGINCIQGINYILLSLFHLI